MALLLYLSSGNRQLNKKSAAAGRRLIENRPTLP
jgi:hypothetical protein